ncbi:MAG: response regulator [Bacteroidota bacterium]
MNLISNPVQKNASVVRQLQTIFSISIVILLVTSVASYYSLQKTIDSVWWVNHTNEVLLEAENMISIVKDAETAQRGFLLTHDERFLAPYTGAYEKASASINKLKLMTNDNESQQLNMVKAEQVMNDRFQRLEETIELDNKRTTEGLTSGQLNMVKGKVIMDQLRGIVNEIKAEENRLLVLRTEEQNTFVNYTSPLIIIAFFISLCITIFSYLKIKADVDVQQARQKAEQEKYIETTKRINAIETVTRKISSGVYSARSDDRIDDELGRISAALNLMTESLEKSITELEQQNWLQTGSVKISDAIRGQTNLEELAENIIKTIAEYAHVPVATFYVSDSEGDMHLTASYAGVNAPTIIAKGEGLLGQAVKNRKSVLLKELPANYHNKIMSSTGSALATHVLIVPFLHGGEVIGALEVCFIHKPGRDHIELLESNAEPIAIGVNSVQNLKKLQEFLEETQAQTEELQAQHNELENMNSELEAQSQKLQASEEELKVQQEELQESNKELEQRSKLLEDKNVQIAKSAEELALTSKYKSEFLANISHELRTPLNSILLLSRLLYENTDKNLSRDQVEYAKVIQTSGTGLLALIDEILDLSKIEAGKMDLDYQTVSVQSLTEDLKSLFSPIAREKNLDFNIALNDTSQLMIETDRIRLDQVLKNLLSNALKFTQVGDVLLSVTKPTNTNFISFTVKDTGIGIAGEKQAQVFEAFQQADGSTRRKFGGTGLGLSISKKLVNLLGGDIKLKSEEGRGSEFTVIIPVKRGEKMDKMGPGTLSNTENTIPKPAPLTNTIQVENKYITKIIPDNISDDRNEITADDKLILIVEDDIGFAKVLLDYTRKNGYKGIVAVRGDEGIEMARKHNPLGILLDIQLPVKSGWEVMDMLKGDPKTRNIPVHIMSSYQVKNESLLKGAVDFINKPVAYEQLPEVFQRIEKARSRDNKKVLIIEDNSKHAKALSYYLETFNINSEVKSTVMDSIDSLKKREVDCVILDMGIPDMKSYQMLEEAKKNPELENLPIIIFTGKSLSLAEESRIKQYADSIIIKTAHSYQRMLDEVSLFLHVVSEKADDESNKLKGSKHMALGDVLNNRTVLVVDDDVRNIFSLSKSLEQLKMNVVTAVDGKEALQQLKDNGQIDIVLLDMMMPEMDGYETATRIRQEHKWKNLPVIAVTAKAMTGDREKCINAGASDYITKPVDVDQLLSLLRVWLYEKTQ